MCNKEQLVAYVYSELSVFEKAAFEAHLRECLECRSEVGQLGQTREHLAAWTPPEPEFAYRMVKSAPPERTEKRRFGTVRQWGLAAAASLSLIAGAAAIANVEVRYGTDGSVVVRSGWRQRPADASAGPPQVQAPAPPQAVPAAASSEQIEQQLLALEQRVNELQATQAAAQGTRAVTPGGAISAPELRRILAESEARQRAELAVYVAQIWKDFSAMRASDLARVQQTLGQAQGLTNLQLRQQRDTIDSLRYLHSVSQQK